MKRKPWFKRILRIFILTFICFFLINLFVDLFVVVVPELPWSFVVFGASVVVHETPTTIITSFEQQDNFLLLRIGALIIVVTICPAS